MADPLQAGNTPDGEGDSASQADLIREVQRLRQRIAELETHADGEGDAKQELGARADALAERVKELACLHRISALLRDPRIELTEIVQEIVNTLPSAWQHADQASASVTLKGRRYQSEGHREPVWRQQAEISVNGEHFGVLEVGYAKSPRWEREPEFLPEEHALLSTVARLLGEIVALKEAERQLWTYQAHLRSLASELTLAEERERHSLALILHDRIGQGLVVAKLKLEALGHLLKPEHQPQLRGIAMLIKQIINDTRALTFEISPPILYELGLAQALSGLADHFAQQFGLPVEVRSDAATMGLTEGVRVLLFRSVQELLSNTARHAQASKAVVTLRNEGGKVHGWVEDDGVGFDVAALSRYPSAVGGFGLFSIRERVEHLGGQMTIDSRPGAGTRIHLMVPRGDGGGTSSEGPKR